MIRLYFFNISNPLFKSFDFGKLGKETEFFNNVESQKLGFWSTV
jgi:hypothetical protein